MKKMAVPAIFKLCQCNKHSVTNSAKFWWQRIERFENDFLKATAELAKLFLSKYVVALTYLRRPATNPANFL